jgi:hypothetical protein
MRTVILFVLCCFAGLAALDLKPLAGPEAPLYAQRREAILAQWQALTIASYEKNGVHGAWDAEAGTLLSHAARMQAGSPSDLPTAEAAALAKRLATPGACSDPLVAWAAWTLTSDRRQRLSAGWKALKAFDADALERPDAARHPRLLEAMVAAELLKAYGREPKEPDRQKALDLAKRVATSIGESIRRDECALFPAVLISRVKEIDLNHQDFGEPVRVAIDEAVAAAKPALWVGCALKGAIRISNAWAWRGSGWADTVTKEGWAGFEQNLKEAETLLNASWQANPADPLAAAYACTLAGTGNSATPLETWMLRSMKACFDHGTAFDVAMNFMKPRWGGSYRQMLALGCDCLDTARFDTDVPWRVISATESAIRDAGQTKGDNDLRTALADARVAAAVDACLDGYLKLSPTKAKRYACIRAAIHWHGGREEQARKALADVPEAELDADVARNFRADLKAIKGPAAKPLPDF